MTENALGGRIVNRQILKLLPLLPLYLALIIVLAPDTFEVAESYYYGYAVHMLQDFGSPPSTLWWGPGYSVALIPFAALDAPILAARLMNAFFLLGALIYLCATLNLYVQERYALLFTYVLGLYPPFLREIHQLRTENLVYLLICGIVFHFCKLFRGPEKKTFHLVAASLYLALLALTKIFFGYVILTGLVLSLLLLAWRRQDPQKKTALFYGLALIWCIPYLLVTYSWTGRVFYWATSGGMSLYWMASPYAGELGNIIHHPLGYLRNWIANVGRLLFSYPFSYTPQKISTYFYLLPNMFLVVFLLVSVYPAVRRRRAIPYEICALLLFTLIALGGTSLLCAYDRQFRPLVPILLLWLSFVYVRILRIELRDTGIGHASGESGLGDAA
jgi:hypothetical protein